MGFWKKPTAVRISRTIQDPVHQLPFQLFILLPAMSLSLYSTVLYSTLHRAYTLQSVQPR